MKPHKHIYKPVRQGSNIARCQICNRWKFIVVKDPIVAIEAPKAKR